MNTNHHPPPPPATTLVAILALATLLSTGCPAVKAPWASEESPDSAETPATTQTPEALAADALALEQRQSEVAAAEAAALEATQKALAEREEVVRLREEQLQKEEALRQEQARIAQRKAESEARERQLAAKEKELENYEANLAFQEKELRDRETLIDETLEAMDMPAEPSKTVEQVSRVEPTDSGDRELFAETTARERTPVKQKPVYASLEPGRLLEIEFEETVSSATHRRGDKFTGRLVQDLTAEDGTLVVPAGAEVIGRVTEATPPKKVGGRASLEVEFTHLVLSPTDTVAISASFVEVGADKRKDKKKIAGAVIVGAILGRVLGGDGAEGVLAGAAAGAAAGTIAVSRGEGKNAEIPKGQIVALQLEEVVTVEIEMTGPVGR